MGDGRANSARVCSGRRDRGGSAPSPLDMNINQFLTLPRVMTSPSAFVVAALRSSTPRHVLRAFASGSARGSKGKCGRLFPLLHFTLRLCLERGHRGVQTIHQFDRCRWRERQAMGDLDHGFLTLYWPFTCFFEKDPDRSKRKTHGATIEDRA